MLIGSGDYTYEWVGNWAKIPDTESKRRGWAHHAVVITSAGEIVMGHPGDPVLLFFDHDGNLLRSVATDLTETHGITLVREGDQEFLWVVDSGAKRDPSNEYQYRTGPRGGQVVKLALDGRVVMRIERPSLPVYETEKYSPTGSVVFEERAGGNGDIWVTDGYGQNIIQRYTKNGSYVGSINGEEGQAGPFTCPHAIWIDTRKNDPELYVADRTNHRIQVYDLDGHYKRVFGSDVLSSPSGMVSSNGALVVIELRARLTVFDEADNFVCYLGANEEVCSVDGWPNIKNERGVPTRTDRLVPGKFNSPHGLAADQDGNLYVSEWLIGGRVTKLAKV